MDFNSEIASARAASLFCLRVFRGFFFSGIAKSLRILLIEEYADIAYKVDCTPAQLALAWLLAQGEHIIPIPGTRHSNWAEENFNALAVTLDEDVLNELDALINQDTVVGNRYPDGVQGVEIDTEDFEAV